MAFWFLNTHRDPPRTQTHCVVTGNLTDDTNTQNNKENAGINNRAYGPRWLSDPLGLSLLQPSQIPTHTFLEQEDDNNWWQMHKQFSPDAINFGQSVEGNWHELTRIPVTQSNILLRFISGWPGGLQQSRTRMRIQNPRQSAILSNKQLTQIFGRSDNALDRHHQRQTKTRRLHTVNDQQHNSRGMYVKIKFWQAQQQSNPSNKLHQCSKELFTIIHECVHQGIQSVVHGEEEQRSRHSLSRLAQRQQNTPLNFTLSFSITDAREFQYITATQRDQIVADFAIAVATREQAVAGMTHNDKAQAWGRWTKYCASVRCKDPFMDELSQQEWIPMLGDFAMAVRQGGFLGECFEVLAEGTVWGAISHVVQAFRAKGRPNPTKDANQELSILLSWQFCAFRNEDPKKVWQKTLSFIILNELEKRQVTNLDKASYNSLLAQLSLHVLLANTWKFLTGIWNAMHKTLVHAK